MTKKIYKLDILQIEKDENLPYWLDPSQRYNPDAEAAQTIRDKHRDRWRKEQKQKHWDEIIERADALGMRVAHPPTEETIKEALKFLGRAFDESEPRDETGKWTGGGGDGGGDGGGSTGEGEHPGAGYSASAYVDKHGVIQTSSVYDAQRALFENRKVELDQVAKTSILIQHLGAVSQKMIKAGKDAPNFNLCNVSVKGTSLFCADSKGIPRVEMPQLDKQQTKDFLKHLKDSGFKVQKEKEFASHLHATQNELNGAKVAGGAKAIMENDGKVKRIVVSKDNYILDGHHAWAAKLGLDAADGKLENDTKMHVSRVNISITKLLAEADKFTGGKGHKDATESKSVGQVIGEFISRMYGDH